VLLPRKQTSLGKSRQALRIGNKSRNTIMSRSKTDWMDPICWSSLRSAYIAFLFFMRSVSIRKGTRFGLLLASYCLFYRREGSKNLLIREVSFLRYIGVSFFVLSWHDPGDKLIFDFSYFLFCVFTETTTKARALYRKQKLGKTGPRNATFKESTITTPTAKTSRSTAEPAEKESGTTWTTARFPDSSIRVDSADFA